jgi:hypothetical protein
MSKFRPSPALAVSTIALLVASGGTSYAAFTLPRNSVGTRQIKNKAVTLPKIAPGAQKRLRRPARRGRPERKVSREPRARTGRTGRTGRTAWTERQAPPAPMAS